ncbi:outer membrane protein assembly factor BamE [Elioraea sp.]|jgi:outer membrane protein assembly factor BamE (lipoprotein component of BamABCDE complex)|uniref:outer membrane protein assembly factor BamE n=1 Tax=Elioraea sp. TaxID=2185103 RepID=UPI003F706834
MRAVRTRPAAALAVIGMLGGCGIVEPTVDPRGHRVETHQIDEIVPGVQTRADVAALLGSPSVTAPFGDDAWFYVSSVTRNRVGRTQAVDQQTVVAIRFDDRGVVQKVETLGLDDATDVTPVSRVTPTPGNDRNFFQLLFGNIGRFSPGDGGGRTPGAGGPF